MPPPSQVALAALVVLASPLEPRAQTTFRASVSSPGFQCAGGSSARPRCLDADGRTALFGAGSVITEQGVVFGSTPVLRRFDLGTTSIAAPNATGGIPATQFQSSSTLSRDGRFLVFIAPDAEFLPTPNPALHVLVRDLGTGTYERASEGPNGGIPVSVSDIAISADGRYVAFAATGALLPADNNGDYDVYVKDRLTGALELATLSPLGQPASYPSSPFPTPRCLSVDISADGRFVTFSSLASNLVVGDTPGTWDVFCRDRVTGVTECMNLDIIGLPSAYGSVVVAQSGDGRFVAFLDGSPNLVPGGTSGWEQIYVRDRWLGQTELVTVATGGGLADDQTFEPALSHDGRYVAFVSRASNLVAGDSPGTADVFLRDRALGTTRRVSIGADNSSVITGVYSLLGISADGSRIAFSANGSNGVPGYAGTSGPGSVYVRDLSIPATPMANYCVAKPFSGGCVAALSVTGIPDTSGATAFQISATGLFGSVSGLNASRMSALAWSFGAPPPPYTPGSLCVAAPVHLLPRRLTGFLVGSCGGWYAETISPGLMTSLGWTPGTTIYTQLYVREPAAANYALSQGVSFVVR